MSKLILTVLGASRGSLVDEGRIVDFAMVVALEVFVANKDASRDSENVGQSSIVYKASPEAFAGIKVVKLPAEFICEIETSVSATKGTTIKLITAKPLAKAA